ncbi:MAG: hypothetical protein G01um101420_229 [Parcubacteria group bacterium Gr01-1014_20]|nr:MAG: hypothetical protein G01um101420_229 [Parcubacteria group bacterium Gr01-1014_20]
MRIEEPPISGVSGESDEDLSFLEKGEGKLESQRGNGAVRKVSPIDSRRYRIQDLASRSTQQEAGKLINFYGRFQPEITNPTELTEANYISALRGVASESSEVKPDYFEKIFGFLSGAVAGEVLDAKFTEPPSPRELYQMMSLVYARVAALALYEKQTSQAFAEIENFNSFLDLQVTEKTKSKEANFIGTLKYDLLQLKESITTEKDVMVEDLPASADEFSIFSLKHNRSRKIPAFKTLLQERLRWHAALNLALNISETVIEGDQDQGELWVQSGPSVDSLSKIISTNYKDSLDLYQTVEKNDTPVYWEAKERLDGLESFRNVVFGRDGLFFFTALKAADFGHGQQDLKYIVVTRNILSLDEGGDAKRIKEKVTRYLKENGVTLDFTFIDTGFIGSIPEFAISCLAEEGDTKLSEDEIDQKITLLSSNRLGRRELSRRGTSERRSAQRSAVGGIEDRPQAINSPSRLCLDEKGRLVPEKVPNSISAQLQAWVVEHTVMRNFSPRVDAKKKIPTEKPDPLEGYTYVEDFRGPSISTHPIELRINEAGEKFLIKSGPDHTVRAELVSAKLFERLHLKTLHRGEEKSPEVAETKLIETDSGPKILIRFIEDMQPCTLKLPESPIVKKKVQLGFVIDALLGQYDRTPWNIMVGGNNRVAFIDHGGSLFSRARGGFKGFPANLSIGEIKAMMDNPQFPGTPVNEAYAGIFDVKTDSLRLDSLKIKDADSRDAISIGYEFLLNLRDEEIEEVVDSAGFLDGRRSIRSLESKIKSLEKELEHIAPGSRDYRMTKEAIMTFKAMIKAGGEANYLKKAIASRKKSLQDLFATVLRGFGRGSGHFSDWP